jgi:hypothetical protein
MSDGCEKENKKIAVVRFFLWLKLDNLKNVLKKSKAYFCEEKNLLNLTFPLSFGSKKSLGKKTHQFPFISLYLTPALVSLLHA